MAFGRLRSIHNLYRTTEIRPFSYLLGSSRSYSIVTINVPEINSWATSYFCKGHNVLPWTRRSTMTLCSSMPIEPWILLNDARSLTTQAKAPAQARQMGALKLSMMSPGIIYEPYAPREPISFWKRNKSLKLLNSTNELIFLEKEIIHSLAKWFTRNGWRRTKEDIVLELKSAYAVAKLRKTGYSRQKFYTEAVDLYKEINSQIANAAKASLRKSVTENMYSALKNEIKQRESKWHKVYWEMVEPVVKIRTLRARMISIDRNDMNKAFIQLTLEFLTKQKFEAYDSEGCVVAGDKDKEVLVRDIWVFEKSLFHPGAYWRLCGRISI